VAIVRLNETRRLADSDRAEQIRMEACALLPLLFA
jgi:hypothetical protein